MKTNINRTIKLSLLVALTAGFILSTKLGERTTHAYSSVPPSSYTGAPSFGASIPAEQTCASSGCHSGTNNLDDGQGTFKIVAPASYVPGQVYTITVSLKRGSTLPAAGFQLMAVDSSGAGEIEMVGKLDTEENSPFITNFIPSTIKEYSKIFFFASCDKISDALKTGPAIK